MRLNPPGLGVFALSLALAAPFENDHDLVGGLVDPIGDALDGIVSGLLGDLNDAVKQRDRNGTIGALQKLKSAKEPPSRPEQAFKRLQTMIDGNKEGLNILDYGGQLVANGLISGSVDELFDYAKGLGSAENSSNNTNPSPPKDIYPKADSCDAPYSVGEDDLRSAIFIPSGFTYGEKPPVILFPGTGTTGYISFKGNFIPLLTNVDWADPVWVNVPGYLNQDSQVNAEYAAYALNYVAAITQRKIGIIAWSQGNINAQWAFKYWPSTRDATSDHIAISADYKGTAIANFATLVGLINSPSVLQQEAGSDFINTLRADGGDSGYVPTTSIYSGLFDEIVEPQQGTDASAYLLDARDVGVNNVEVQTACQGKLAGSLYTHESALVNPLAFALAKDALTHDGPGRVSRLDLGTVCNSYLSPGLGIEDLLITENSIAIAAISLLTYLPKVLVEPNIMQYASASGQCG